MIFTHHLKTLVLPQELMMRISAEHDLLKIPGKCRILLTSERLKIPLENAGWHEGNKQTSAIHACIRFVS